LVPQIADPHSGAAPGAPALAQPLSRRRLFKVAGAAGLALAGGAWVFKTVWKLGPPGPGLVCLTENEYEISQKVAEAFFPGPPHTPLSANEAALSDFADAYIGGLYEDNARLFKLLFRTLNLSTVLVYGRSFYWLDLSQRQTVLRTWAESNLLARRAGYQSLRFLYAMGYFEDERVRRAVGFKHGCDLSGRSPVAPVLHLEPKGAP
jgi:hypothetical protein